MFFTNLQFWIKSEITKKLPWENGVGKKFFDNFFKKIIPSSWKIFYFTYFPLNTMALVISRSQHEKSIFSVPYYFFFDNSLEYVRFYSVWFNFKLEYYEQYIFHSTSQYEFDNNNNQRLGVAVNREYDSLDP